MKFRTSAPAARSTAVTTRRGSRFAARAFVTTGTAVLFVGIAGVPAFAEPGVEDTGSTTANVAVASSISLDALTSAFTITGAPGATVTSNDAVTMTVATNNFAGYSVTVVAGAASMTGSVGYTDEIPISALKVRESAVGDAGAFTDMSSTTPVTTHTQATSSGVAADPLSNDYQVVIPTVEADTYTATLNYVATTL